MELSFCFTWDWRLSLHGCWSNWVVRQRNSATRLQKANLRILFMLANIPMIFILLGLAAYIVLAGADFGTGFWTLVFYRKSGDRVKFTDSLHNTMGPVWEANHVWLIFILVVCWTAYPVAFASITSTLSVPLLIAAVGIISRGAAYALRSQFVAAPKERSIDDRVFAVSSVVAPFALGAVIGGIASGRVPVGNAAGNLMT